MTDDDIPRYAPKAFIAKEILSLLYILPREQILQMDLTWLRRRDLRLIYREIKKTYADSDCNSVSCADCTKLEECD